MSTLKVNQWLNSDGTENYKCRAWVNYNGLTNTIRASGNVSSVTDRADGRFTVNLTNALTDANYATSITASNDSSPTSGMACMIDLPFAYPTASAVPIIIGYPFSGGIVSGGYSRDTQYVNVAVFR